MSLSTYHCHRCDYVFMEPSPGPLSSVLFGDTAECPLCEATCTAKDTWDMDDLHPTDDGV
jgi:rubredoxin